MPFPGIILSPMGRACVSCQDKELIAVKGLAVVDCSWNRLEEVPFGGSPSSGSHQLRPLTMASHPDWLHKLACAGHPTFSSRPATGRFSM